MPASVGGSSYSSLIQVRCWEKKNQKNSVSFSFYVGKDVFGVIDSETDDVIRRVKVKWKSSGSFGSLAIKVLLFCLCPLRVLIKQQRLYPSTFLLTSLLCVSGPDSFCSSCPCTSQHGLACLSS